MERPRLSHLLNFSQLDKESNLLKHFLEKGGTLQEILKLPKKKLNALYFSGYQHHQNQEYTKAKPLFALLTLFCPDVPKFWWALGASQVALDEYQEALDTYTILTLLEPDNPQPHFFSAFCHQRLGNHTQAVDAFERGSSLHRQRSKHE